MPPASATLEEILTRWGTRGRDLRQEATFQKDLIDPLALAANGNYLAIRERYRRDTQQMEQQGQEAQARWEERLHRIEEWQNAVRASQEQAGQFQGIINSILWLDNARTHLETFTQRLNRRAELLSQERQVLHQKLAVWSDILEERERQLQDLMQKETQSKEPLYVSRARKQPEIDFLNEQRAVNETLGKEMQQLRSTLSLSIGRLQKAVAAMEQRSSTPQILYEASKKEIEAGLMATEKLLQALRVHILSDALIYEACRCSLRHTEDIVRKLRCIEDVPQDSKTDWKKFFSLDRLLKPT